ncbi:MAG: branched-chain amino acid ABC transporter permease [Candidatus Hodarchaeales archaeon]|jgi:neutral amino acid transport system permease protein
MAIIPVDLVNNFSLAIVYAAMLIMVTVGLNMVYSVMKFSNFAHAEWVTMGMFMAWWFLQILSYIIPWDTNNLINNLISHAIFAFIAVGFLGILGEVFIFGRLKRIKASPRSFTVASIGIGLVVRNLLSMIFGAFPDAKTVDCPTCNNTPSMPSFLDFSWFSDLLHGIGINWITIQKNLYHVSFIEDRSIGPSLFPDLYSLLGRQEIRITGFELYIIIMSLVMVLAIDYMFKSTKFGIAMRATSDSMELAQVSGINTTRIIYYTWFLAAGLTGLGASFIRANQGSFNMYNGFYLLLPIFAVVILGGVGSFRGGIIAALIIAISRQLTNILFTQFQRTGGLEDLLQQYLGFTVTFSPNYLDGVSFLVLIIVLLFRPQGIFGSVEATRARV